MPNLKSITLQLYRVKSDSDFPLDGIERLKHLESLDLSDNEVVNDFLLGFLVEKCPQLKELNLAGTGNSKDPFTVRVSKQEKKKQNIIISVQKFYCRYIKFNRK